MSDRTSHPLVVENLTKRYGNTTVVDDVTFTVKPGRITGFLGPNGSGKSTTMKMMLDLARPTPGRATIGGRRYRQFPDPLAVVGAMVEADAYHPGRSGRNHLLAVADAAGIHHRRVDDALEEVGLTGAARRQESTASWARTGGNPNENVGAGPASGRRDTPRGGGPIPGGGVDHDGQGGHSPPP